MEKRSPKKGFVSTRDEWLLNCVYVIKHNTCLTNVATLALANRMKHIEPVKASKNR